MSIQTTSDIVFGDGQPVTQLKTMQRPNTDTTIGASPAGVARVGPSEDTFQAPRGAPNTPEANQTPPGVVPSPVQSREERLAELRATLQANLDAALAQGRQRAEETFGVGLDLPGLASGNIKDLGQLSRKGYDSGLLSGIRGAAQRDLARNQAQSLTNFRRQAGASGVRGGAALLGSQRLADQAAEQSQKLNLGLAQQETGIRERALANLQKAVNQERAAGLATEFGFGQLGLGLDQTALGALTAEDLATLTQQRAGEVPGQPSNSGVLPNDPMDMINPFKGLDRTIQGDIGGAEDVLLPVQSLPTKFVTGMAPDKFKPSFGLTGSEGQGGLFAALAQDPRFARPIARRT